MLNEGYALMQSLERCGIVPPKRHPDIKKLGKKRGLIVGLNGDRKVESVEFRNAVEMSKLWKISDGLKNSFPAMALAFPLLNINAYLKNEAESIKNVTNFDMLKKIWHKYGLNENIKNKNGKNLKQPFFSDWQSTITKLKERKNNIEHIKNEAEAYKVLLRRMERFDHENSDRDLAQEITTNIFSALENGILKFEDAKDFLLSIKPDVFIFIDLADYENFQIRVASPKIVQYISNCLLEKQLSGKSNTDSSNNPSSALSGIPNVTIGKKFPNPNLSIIGITNLFGVDKNTPCLRRYGRTGPNLFPVDSSEANAIQDSIIWITDEIRQGKTWYPVPGVNESESDLLIVYLEGKPDFNVNKAYMLGGTSKNYFSEGMYESISSNAIKALKAEKLSNGSNLVKLFAIRKVDKMRRQIALQRAYTISDLLLANADWHNAAKNIPNISILFFRNEIERIIGKQKNILKSISTFLNDSERQQINMKPNCPFPPDLVRLTQRQWRRRGLEYTSIPGITLGEVYDVYFAYENVKKHTITHLLDRTLQCTKPLILGLGEADHKNELKGFNIHARFTLLRAVSIIGICLYKLGIVKENYMKDRFFYVGKFLSLIDTLHYEWCKNVRDGNIPPQLLGNAHLQIALDNPVSAIDILSRRINVYQAWTKKEKTDKVRLARWAVGELGAVSNLLSEKTLPTSTTSAERAQILLGYLSKEKKTENDL